jgi:hypothetical protein
MYVQTYNKLDIPLPENIMATQNTKQRQAKQKHNAQKTKKIRNTDLTKHRYSGKVSRSFGFKVLLFTED